MSPEMLLKTENQNYNHKVDIWAVGIILFKMLQGWIQEPYPRVKGIQDLIKIHRILDKNKTLLCSLLIVRILISRQIKYIACKEATL